MVVKIALTATAVEGDKIFRGFHNIIQNNHILCRSYLASNAADKRSVIYDDAYNFCNDRGLGLAVWKSAEAYEDIKYMTKSNLNKAEVYTALNNENEEDCNTDDGNTDCDGKLIWRQNKCGPYEFFKADPGHTK